MSEKKSELCAGGPKLIFACSGAADVGEISDLAARKMTKNGQGKMFCMAGIGGRIKGIMDTTKGASKVLAIDGCSLDCVKNCLELAGIAGFEHLRVTDMGMEKGKTGINNQNIDVVVQAGADLLS